jgi:hypothetical protein
LVPEAIIYLPAGGLYFCFRAIQNHSPESRPGNIFDNEGFFCLPYCQEGIQKEISLTHSRGLLPDEFSQAADTQVLLKMHV